MDPFTECLRDATLFEKLAQYPEVRKHLADPGFYEELQKLQTLVNDTCSSQSSDIPTVSATPPVPDPAVGQKVAQAAHRDPRIMQALMCLQGQGLIVEESDLRHAEQVGDMKRREPVQLEQLLLVKDLQDAEEARVKGNAHFKAGELSEALAHYEKGIELLKQQSAIPAANVATLLSNAALCLIKLKWPDRAKKKATMAIVAIKQATIEDFDLSKVYYRRALACEALREFEMAVDDMLRAFQHAKKTSTPAELHRLKGEVERLKKLKASADAELAKKKLERQNEKSAEAQRLQGAEVTGAGYAAQQVSAEYLAEQDFSHWTLARVCEAVVGVTHTAQSGATIEVREVQDQSTKVSASITNKRGKRALYYDMDLHCLWQGKSAGQEMQGLIRVYNIAHDTKFELGGDENTSYMYQLGWDQRKSGSWVDELKTEAAELFDLIAVKVDGVIKDLRKK
mmetsp:Transcript_39061/g.72761  ORF Transcript_39061/g.72761 Transcript_39061/m.72761 type:complete len:454 (-) Transcript_39061:120-1481(-)